ncbi:MAG: U32 family peptidase [bacterium]|nr:U32 family peptidase [bacterium]
MNKIELLAPARDLAVGIAVINCGADAVYIGANRFGARDAAGNSLDDIARLCDYAHKYWAKIYVTLNTILFDNEIPAALKLISQFHNLGIDGLIIQDVGLLEHDLPPIPLIASTQMHNDSSEKIQFLEKIGFHRVILARELAIEEIKNIRKKSSIELEFFIHGALCVCYSGQCCMSYAIGGRSGNRGECAQPCRRSYSLLDRKGNTLVADRYLLSPKDLNLSDYLEPLIHAGITSFKIEGRLKDKFYVMNIVGHYRKLLDILLNKLASTKTSSGTVTFDFTPDPFKSFNRGFTKYFVNGRDENVAAIDSPKSIGEPIGKVVSVAKQYFTIDAEKKITNGDGICFFDDEHHLEGTLINQALGNKIYPDKMKSIKPGAMIYRNHDQAFIHQLENSKASRKISVKLKFSESPDGFSLSAEDEDGNKAQASIAHQKIPAEKQEQALKNIRKQLTKLGASEYHCSELTVELREPWFIALSVLNELRRVTLELLTNAREQNRPRNIKEFKKNDAPFPEKTLSYLGNALNRDAVSFYQHHGVETIAPAAESGLDMVGKKVMTTKYCIAQQLGICKKNSNQLRSIEPLYLVDEKGQRYRLNFDCNKCAMEIYFEKQSESE